MVDLRPAGYVIGLLLMVLGLTMVIPMGLDWLDSSSNWLAFALSSFIIVITKKKNKNILCVKN
jgi:trk system potassium uptake protein TrkH